ncbi:MAG: LysE family translocator [Methanocalculus sp. MSAO_Arc1]|uniref:LysE family transporter n=1 Tax=Methanocalculus TaxID=71151 RepID=UPI000FF433D0|nr:MULTISPECIES: LysE family transporter [unclassified Methanocalculus]MCP1662300.1 threonine/homoserine/homoserine lactone efflux protein [Methanocalculus sp. AMF5]RQD80938.1 MAG: LysE family translocator [Methanocalculus sp. MSAO_Arc1]
MPDLISIFLIGLVIGFTGALAPGPTLVATINASVRSGWRAGPLVSLGHVAAEIGVILLIVAGLGAVIGSATWAIGLVGGISLVLFGLLTISSARGAALPPADASIDAGKPVAAGLLTSVANPYFWIWWFTVGAALLWSFLEGGLLAGGIFMAGHWAADIGWLTLVSASIHRGRFFLSDSGYRLILVACGIFLIAFGCWFVSGSL